MKSNDCEELHPWTPDDLCEMHLIKCMDCPHYKSIDGLYACTKHDDHEDNGGNNNEHSEDKY